MQSKPAQLAQNIAQCQLCRDRFAQTTTAHQPRPVVWFRPQARILIAGQAPGLRVHQSGQPFTDPSGDRLREWMGIAPSQFYDRDSIAIVPMAFCFPGYNARNADLPPPKICASTWHEQVVASLDNIRLTLLIGTHAQTWHLRSRMPVRERVANWRSLGPDIFPLPHPSWRNNRWLIDNPWFEQDLLPQLRARIRTVLND